MGFLPTNQSWLATVQAKGVSAELDRFTPLLFAYNARAAGDVDERLRIIDKIQDLVIAYLKEGLGPDFAEICGLGFQAEKERIAERERIALRATKAWNVARTIFRPSMPGGTHTIQHWQEQSANRHQENASMPAPTAVRNYWLEALDPKHRSWGHIEGAKELFERWLHSTTTKSFWEWLDEDPRNLAHPCVQYLAPDERWKVQIHFGKDRKLYRQPQEDLAVVKRGANALTIFSTIDKHSTGCGQGYAAWVCAPWGTFFSHSHEESLFHHSSFLGGRRVLAAGEWIVLNGEIKFMTYKSGHYATTAFQMAEALRILEFYKNVDLSKTVVANVIGFKPRRYKCYKALDYITYGGNEAVCPTVNTPDGVPVTEANAAMDIVDPTGYRV